MNFKTGLSMQKYFPVLHIRDQNDFGGAAEEKRSHFGDSRLALSQEECCYWGG